MKTTERKLSEAGEKKRIAIEERNKMTSCTYITVTNYIIIPIFLVKSLVFAIFPMVSPDHANLIQICDQKYQNFVLINF